MSDDQVNAAADDECPLANHAEMLAYQPSAETDGAAQAYRIVGWFLLLHAMAGFLASLVTHVLLMRVPRADLVLVVLGTSISTAVGGFGMIRMRSWGAIVAMAGELLLAVVILTQVSNAGSGLQRAVLAFLAYAIWQLCRRRGVFAGVTSSKVGQ